MLLPASFILVSEVCLRNKGQVLSPAKAHSVPSQPPPLSPMSPQLRTPVTSEINSQLHPVCKEICDSPGSFHLSDQCTASPMGSPIGLRTLATGD